VVKVLGFFKVLDVNYGHDGATGGREEALVNSKSSREEVRSCS
jgi:hypothetical protein